MCKDETINVSQYTLFVMAVFCSSLGSKGVTNVALIASIQSLGLSKIDHETT